MLLTFVRDLIKMIFLLYCCKCKFLFFIADVANKKSNLILRKRTERSMWFLWESFYSQTLYEDMCKQPFVHSLYVSIQISRLEVFCRKSFLKKFAKVLWKHLWWSLLNKPAGQAGDFIKRDCGTGIFLWILRKF